MENVEMFGIAILKPEDNAADVFEDSTQYLAEEWFLEDFKQYTGKYVVIYLDGNLEIYEPEGDQLYKGSLLDSKDFKEKLLNKISSLGENK